jgi:hypothetical protein
MPSPKFALKPYIPVALFFLAIFCLYTTPIVDGDFFWHVSSGQWIWEHKALPQSDPFSYMVPQLDPTSYAAERIRFTLQQYWLGQLALFGIWNSAGAAGIVLLRAVSYSGILALLFFWMRSYSRGILPLLLVFLTGTLLQAFPSERPQLFSFIFMPLTLYLLERIRAGGRNPSVRLLIALPLIMLVWANCHAGFILGVILVLIYLFANVLGSVAKKEPFCRRANLCLLSAALITSLNPCGVTAFRVATAGTPVTASIQEYLSPLQAAVKLHYFFPGYWFYLLLVAGTIACKFRVMKPVHTATLAALSLLSLSGLRYLAFPLMASPLLVPYLREREWPRKWTVATLLLVVWMATADWERSFTFSADRLFPEKAARFIAAAKPAGEIFNYYDWGGYFMCRIPGRKVFIDGRGLVDETTLLYEKALWGADWKGIFDRYRVNTVAIPAISKSTGETYPLAGNLLWDKEWHLVYRDDVSLVFVRATPANAEVIGRHELGKEEIHRHVLLMLKRLPKEVWARGEYWISRGNACYFLGDFTAAAAAFTKAVEIDPGNEWARRMLRQLGG